VTPSKVQQSNKQERIEMARQMAAVPEELQWLSPPF
jgi:hypothetical protein